MTSQSRGSLVSALIGAIVLTMATAAVADPLKCERAVAKASAKYVQGRTKALDKCELGKTKGQFAPSTLCTGETKTAGILGILTTKFASSIAKACGGADKICGNGDDDSLASIGWGGVPNCPDFETPNGCTNAINNCADIATCLTCIHNVAVDQALATYYGNFVQGEFGTNSAVNKCQQAIGKATSKFIVARSKALQKCWDLRLKNLHSNPCPNPGDPAGKTMLLISKAEGKKVSAICKACGGADKLCDGTGDLSPAAIGFSGTCPDVTTFEPSSCTGAIVDAQDIVDCVDCVSTFKTDCMDAVAVPEFVSPLPLQCNPNQTTTTTTTSTSSSSSTSTSSTSSTSTSSTSTSSTSSTSTTSTSTSSTSTSSTTSTSTSSTSTSSTSTSSTSSSSTSTSSTTSTSSSTTSSTSTSSTTTTSTSSTTTSTIGTGPTKFDFLTTTGTGACGQTFRDLAGTIPLKNLLCANLSLGGGKSQVPDNTTPAGSTNRFGLSCTGSACTVSAVPAGGLPAGVECTDTGCNFGTILPISNAGLSVCIANTFSGPAGGTLNTGTGDVNLNVPLTSTTILTSTPTQPCPICRIGTTGGAPCAGTPASPCTGVCEGSPNQGAACVSRNPNGLTNDCPVPAADPLTQKCFKGSNNGATCAAAGDCPGGVCAQFIGNIAVSLNPLTTGTATKSSSTGNFCPGQTSTQKGAFKSDICLSGTNSGKPCTAATATADCGAGVTCKSGTLNNYCNGGTNDGKGCTLNTDCGTVVTGTCVQAGTLVQLIREVGAPGTGGFALNTPKAVKLGSVFCVGVTTNGTVNGNANLPGPGATSLTGTITTLP